MDRFSLYRKYAVLHSKLGLNLKLRLDGNTFNVPIVNNVGWANYNMSEKWMVSILSQLKVKHGMMDIGVNVGQSLLKFKSVYPGLNYIGFEPNPTCVDYVNKLIHSNHFEQTVIYPFGIGNHDFIPKLQLYSESSTDPSASIMINERPNNKVFAEIPVSIRDFKEIENQISCPQLDLIKIDVEGAEISVLEGIKHYVKKYTPTILIEILPVYNKENTNRLERQLQIESIVKDYGYRIYRIIKEGDQFISLKELEAFGIHDNLNWCDYVLAPSNPFY